MEHQSAPANNLAFPDFPTIPLTAVERLEAAIQEHAAPLTALVQELRGMLKPDPDDLQLELDEAQRRLDEFSDVAINAADDIAAADEAIEQAVEALGEEDGTVYRATALAALQDASASLNAAIRSLREIV